MLRIIKTFNGTNINDGTTYVSTGLNFDTPATAILNYVSMANADPVDAGLFNGEARNLAILVHVLSEANYDAAKIIFKRGTAGYLVVTFSDDSQDYQMYCRIVSFLPHEQYPGYYKVILQSGESSWRRVTAETASWTADDANLTKAITVAGKENTRLIASITPTAAPATGWQLQYLYQLINKKNINHGTIPWCITLDTAAMVTAGNLQADCDDLRIVLNDVEAPRWIADANTDHTHIWFNVTLGPGFDLTLQTAVPSSGAVGELVFKNTTNNNLALSKLPASGILVHDGEWFQYSGKSVSLRKVAVVARGALGTTLAAHAADSTFQYIQNVIYVLADNSAATDPAAADTNYDISKPVFDLSASDNTQWVYTASTLFYDPDHPTRPGSWVPSIATIGRESKIYNITQDGESGAPAMGMLMSVFYRNGWKSETATIAWQFTCAGGIATIAATGSKYRTTAKWPAACAMQKFTADGKWLNVWAETSPVNEDTWTAVNQAAASIGNLKKARFLFKGTILALADAAAYFELLTVTIAFYTTNLPAGTLYSSSNNYPMVVTLANTTNGDSVAVTYPMQINNTMLLDGEDYEASVDGVNAHGAVELDDPSRDVWIRLAPGSNTLSVASDQLGTLSIALSWYPRRP